MIKREILVAYDGSELSQKALDEEKLQADSKLDTKIHLISVVTQMGPAPHPGVAHSIQREIAETLRGELELVEKGFTDVGIQTQIEIIVDDKQRNAGHMITEYAEEKEVDIIMIGNRGLGNVSGLFLGSVSSQVIQHACSAMRLFLYPF